MGACGRSGVGKQVGGRYRGLGEVADDLISDVRGCAQQLARFRGRSPPHLDGPGCTGRCAAILLCN